jgi:hypothetical protein
MEKDIKNISNNELAQMQKTLSNEWSKVKVDLIKLYDYWMSIEKKYNEINDELNNRFGVNNK